MTLIDVVIKVVVPFIVTVGGFFIVYGQYLLLKDRAEYKRKHGVDPWRHGWEKYDK